MNKNITHMVLQPTKLKRFLFFLLADVLLLSISLASSFFIRFEFTFPEEQIHTILRILPIVLILKIFTLYTFRLYHFNWMFVGIREMMSIINSCLISSGLVYFFNMSAFRVYLNASLPRSVILIDFFMSVFLISNLRVAKRLYTEAFRPQLKGSRTLIVGAGPTGERLVREFQRSTDNTYHAVAIADDDINKIGTNIHGVRVAGTIKDIPQIVEEYKIERAIIAITTAKHFQIKEFFDLLKDAGVKDIKVVPHLDKLPSKSLTISDIHDLKIEDLLYREAVQLNLESIRNLLQSKVILVTGAAGSIGSEIVRQTLQYHPSKLIVFDIDESEVYNLMLQIKPLARVSTTIIPYIGDIRREHSLSKLFQQHTPQIVFHAAAYKHVPMMEIFPEEALETNFIGTYNISLLSVQHNVQKLVNISTDKAVNPTSIMGATKRLAEMVCSTFEVANGTRFVSVRFGNVLGSRGSVVPVFLEQIRQGKTVTVTHPDVERFFMTIPEAVSLVFQAASMGKGGEVFVLDMGKPVKIIKLAEDLIKLNGIEPYKDINIEFIGLRPGEKLFEELLTAEEGTTSTEHVQIFIARNTTKFDEHNLRALVQKVQNNIYQPGFQVRDFLKSIVPFYQKQ
ncbi:polysaccharide biosynthesis protein [bacterium]|nr:polysaccharide biosynthesis protein [bacterium]